jgi:aminotransferase
MASEEFAIALLREKRVVTYPGSEFGELGEGFLRMTLAAPTARFCEAVNRIQEFVRMRLH